MRQAFAIILALLACAGVQLTYCQPADAVGVVNVAANGWRAMDATLAEAKKQMQVDPAAAEKLAVNAETDILRQEPSRSRTLALIKARWLRGEADLRLNEPEKAAPLIDYGLKMLRDVTHPFKLKRDLLLSQGFLRSLQANPAGALQDYQSSYLISRALGDTRSQAVALLSIGSLYRDAGDPARALSYDRQADDIYAGDINLSFSSSNNEANALAALDRFKEADAQYRRALALAKRKSRPSASGRNLWKHRQESSQSRRSRWGPRRGEGGIEDRRSADRCIVQAAVAGV